MHYILSFVILFSFNSQAMTPKEFLQLPEGEKADFLENESNENSNPDHLVAFKNKINEFDKLVSAQVNDMTDLWWDTILEGPYGIEGKPSYSVDYLYEYENFQYAALININQKAFFTEDDNCTFDEIIDLWIDCEEGIISESFYIDFAGNVFSGENNYPEYYN